MTNLAWLTPETVPLSNVCMCIRTPDSSEFRAIVRGALDELTKLYNWEKHGALSPQDCVDVFVVAWDGMVNGNGCVGGGAVIPVATIFYSASASAPVGALVANGQVVSTLVYPDLFAAIGYTYGGAGASFNIPNLIDNVAVGAGNLYPLGSSGGETNHQLITSEMPLHFHTIPNTVAVSNKNAGPEEVLDNAAGSTPTSSEGGDQPHNNMQPYTALTPLIQAV